MAAYRQPAALALLLLASALLTSPASAIRKSAASQRLYERPMGVFESLKTPRSILWPSGTRPSTTQTPSRGTAAALEPLLTSAHPSTIQAASGERQAVPVVDPPRRVAGYFLLDRTKEAQMFYFLFRSRSRDTDPLVLWMTGGPGCSSELAVFYENGPYSINKNLTLTETKHGWDMYHNLLFIDQPINTGFSYSHDDEDRVYDEDKVASDMLDFLQEFFKVHPDLAERDLYITGESYAGHYVPAVSHRVWLANRNAEGPRINLKGLAIGNGLTNPAIQYGAYADFALENKLIDQPLRDSIQWLYPVCRFTINLCNAYPWQIVCRAALYWCQSSVFGQIMANNYDMNVYDISKKCDGPLCYDFTAADTFLNNAAVQASLGVDNIEWEGCNMGVNYDMQGDFMLAYHELLPEMMADGMRVMIYAGELDFICNWLGNMRWVAALEWPGQQEWALSADNDWTAADGTPAGSVREVGPLSFVRVAKAGHMVPMDQPAHALEMITKFTRGVSLADAETLDASRAATAMRLAAAAAHRTHATSNLKLVLGRHQLSGGGTPAQ